MLDNDSDSSEHLDEEEKKKRKEEFKKKMANMEELKNKTNVFMEASDDEAEKIYDLE